MNKTTDKTTITDRVDPGSCSFYISVFSCILCLVYEDYEAINCYLVAYYTLWSSLNAAYITWRLFAHKRHMVPRISVAA